MIQFALEQLKENKIEFISNEPMKNHTSFKIGGAADLFVLPKTEEQFLKAFQIGKKAELPITVVGNGSNLLVSDNGIEGMTLCTLKMNSIELISEDEIFAEAGASLTAVCLFALKHSLTGLEFAYGIPGSIGGALYMNAGAYGGEMANVVSSANSMDQNGNLVTRNIKELGLGYRESVYKQNGEIITGVTLKLKKGESQEISKQMELLMGKRKTSQPLDYPSAGSTFKRPVGYYAAALIDECGLKGLTVGDAQVSTKHAGFVINKEKATCKDVLELIKKIQNEVLTQKGVKIDTEVIFIGR